MKKWFETYQQHRRSTSVFASAVLVLLGVLLMQVVVSVGYNVYLQNHLQEKLGVQRLQALGSTLAKSTESLLSSGEISAVRRLITETAQEHKLEVCQLVLPDVGIMAAANPGHITVIDLPEQWVSDNPVFKEKLTANYLALHYPVTIPGRGTMVLEIGAIMGLASDSALEAYAAPMAGACLALSAILVVYCRTAARFRAIGAVHDVLLGAPEAQGDLSSLHLDPQLGPMAVAWNQLLGEQHHHQVRSAMEQVKKSMHDHNEPRDDLARACDALPIGMILVDGTQQSVYANGAAAVLLQTTTDAITQGDLNQWIEDERVVDAITVAVQQPGVARRVIELGSEGSAHSGVLRFTVRPIHGDESNLALVMVEDVTQQRVAAAARDSFLAQATHELRSPLTSIRLYVEKALDDTETDPDAVARSLNIVNEESRRLERVVSEILSVSEIEAGSFHLERDDVRLDTMLEQLQRDLQTLAQKHEVTMVFDLPPKLPILHADRDKIAVALHNLLGNAVKYTPAGGKVMVHVEVEEAHIEVQFVDTGIGIREEDQSRIFEKFYRAKDRRIAKITGSGLGLAISREVIRLQGGDITVESTLDQGSIFTLTLPIPEEAQERERANSTMRSR